MDINADLTVRASVHAAQKPLGCASHARRRTSHARPPGDEVGFLEGALETAENAFLKVYEKEEQRKAGNTV